MHISSLARDARIIGAAALFASCGGSQPPIGASSAMPQSRATATQAERSGSWMLPEARSDDLMYVAHEYATYVSVYSYPDGRLVGTVSNPDYANGDCVDAAGDVYIVNFDSASSGGGDVVEYAHGGTSPIKTLTYPNAYLSGCAVDPSTGNLAVTEYRPSNGHNGKGGVLIYRGASGQPTKYVEPGMTAFGYCAYDSAGNLYLDATNLRTGNFQLAELPKGKQTFTNIKLSKWVETDLALSVGGVQCDGKSVVIGNGRTASHDHVRIEVYRIHVTGSKGRLVGTTVLKRAHSLRNFQFWIQGSTILSPYGSPSRGAHDYKLGFWSYPQGNLAKSIFDRAGPWAVTVSLASR